MQQYQYYTIKKCNYIKYADTILLKTFHVSMRCRKDSHIHICCHWLIVARPKFDALKTNMLVLRTSNF